ncbi:hypothetical protein HJ049_03800 [Vibrio parahaemolyticus]|nr:bacteriophage abortive infection AbiH family protein [Vibrio alginolyticus]MBE5178983.1 hypothetical protein [Vibrio parahaemolyticus]
MSTLYVIGNGFDLWHGLSTRYQQFYEFAKDTLDEVGNYYSFELSVPEPWHDFENALGDYCWEHFFDFHNEVDVKDEGFRPSQLYGLEDELSEQTDLHVNSIRNCFTAWVEQIDVCGASKQMAFPEDARFISFNYTSTLQAIYDIADDKVLHIHGNVEQRDELVFGHGMAIQEAPEFDEHGESNRSMFSDAEAAAKYPLYALKKPVDDVLERYKDYFESLDDISEMVVIGHSLNEVDLPYFKRLADSAPKVNWTVSYYSPDDKETHIDALTRCGINRDQINACSYDELSKER